nr:D-alanyl-D-alanine carboxypeptidase family protein [Paracoccus onubensis]
MVPVTASAAPFAAYVMDARTGKPIYTQNADTKLHPASLTKMMTLYLAFLAVERGQVRLDSKFTVSSNAAAEPPSKLGLRAGQQIELRYLIRAAAIKSANDAATAIGEGLAGSEDAFAQQMTQMARALGMNNTQFRNANGLTQDGHYSTAHDMSVLGRRLFYDFPQYYNLFSRRSADAGIATVSQTNKRFLDDYAGADGIKTGYTRAAGFNLTASAKHGNKRLIATVFGGTSTAQRNQVMAQLLDSSFTRVPTRVREVRPGPPPTLTTRIVRRAQVEPSPAATSPQTQRLTLNSSAPPQPSERVAVAAPPAPQPQAAAMPSNGQLALNASTRPRIRPAAEANAIDDAVRMAAASTKSDATAESDLAEPVLAVSSRPVPSPRSRAVAAAPAANDAGNPSTATVTAEAEPADLGNSGSMSLVASTPPEPRSETVIVAAMGEGDISSPEAVEIVSRKENSGRNYGIVLGMYRSKAEADRLVMEIALRQGDVLSGAARHVADTNRGFQPSFANLTLADAQLTCEQLQAKQQECRVVGP